MRGILLAALVLLPARSFGARKGEGSDWTFLTKSVQELTVLANAPASPERDKRISAIRAGADAAVAAKPEDGAVQALGAQVSLQLGDHARALSRADAAVRLAEEKRDAVAQAEALRVRSLGRYYTGDLPGAFEDASLVLAAVPDDPVAKAVAGLSKGRGFRRGDAASAPAPTAGSEALVALAASQTPRVRADRPANLGPSLKYLAQAETTMKLGHHEDSIRLADQALRLVADNPRAYLQRAFANVLLRRPEAAVVDATLGLSLQPDSAQLRALRAAALVELGRHAEAKDDALAALALQPGDAMAWLQKARAREGLREAKDEVLADYRRAAELNPRFRDVYEEALTRYGGQSSRGSEAADDLKAAAGLLRRVTEAGTAMALLLGIAVTTAGGFALYGWLKRPKDRPGPPTPDAQRIKGQFELGERIAGGGMGDVFKGWDRLLKRPVAIKRLRAELQEDPRERERFVKEAETVAQLRDPHIVEIHTIVQEKGQTYLVFEFIEGKTLQQALDEKPRRRMSAAEVEPILQAVARALDHAHAKHVIHRDLKPSNVMVSTSGWIKVMDFGIARQAKDSMGTRTNTVAGTPHYMAPEQALGQVARQSDTFALGVTVYELLTGTLPFGGPDPQSAKTSGTFPPPSTAGLPAALDAFFLRALAPQPEDRFASGAEFYEAFRAASRAKV